MAVLAYHLGNDITYDQHRSSKKKPLYPTRQNRPGHDERRYPLSLLLVGVGAVLTLAVASWLGLLANGKDVSLEITEVKRAEERRSSIDRRPLSRLNASRKTL